MKKTKGKEPLTFKVAAHLVQDLGLNLYTSLPRVLVEFLANAHDANAPHASVTMDFDAIQKERKVLKAQFDLDRAKAPEEDIEPLSSRTLPDACRIVIQDDGHGMSRDDLQHKFLFAGRRRRLEERTSHTEGGKRVLMGRKGLGKLAGFGVARRVEVITRRAGEAHATRIELDYEDLLKHSDVQGWPVPEETLANGGGIKNHGTRIELSRLVYDSTKSRSDTFAHEIGDHFAFIKPAEFRVDFNGKLVKPTPRNFEFAYPEPGKVAKNELVEKVLPSAYGDMQIRYRIRFTMPNQALPARERGVRVYASRRLASAPDLLDVTTNMHGFHNTQYLDAVCEADFIDQDNRTDLIATDRQSLRWDVGRLEDLRAFLTKEMEDACRAYQYARDQRAAEETKNDKATIALMERYKMPAHRRRVAMRVATLLAGVYPKGKDEPQYKEQLEIFLDGLTQGDIIGALSKLARVPHPDFREVVTEISKLTEREVGDFLRYAEGRLDGIEALEKICKSVDFKKGNNERELHELFERNPWMINPTLDRYVSSNKTEDVLLQRLAKLLKVGAYVPAGYDPKTSAEADPMEKNERPDLVFILGGTDVHRIVIVELKAPNTPLHWDHLGQLHGYMARVSAWLSEHGKADVRVEGILIGSLPDPSSKADKAVQLRQAMKKDMNKADWTVRDVLEVLEDTRAVHQRLYTIRQDALKSGAGEDEAAA